MYIAVLPITKSGKNFKINGTGKIVEYTLKMKELPQENIMENLIKANNPIINETTIIKLAKIIADFHSTATTNEHINQVAMSSIKYNWNENFKQAEQFVGKTISEKEYSFIKKQVDSFMKLKKDVFKERMINGKLRECHGDLYTGNIFITDKIYIFDIIEFNERFRYCDCASDIAFLSMDLEHLKRKDLSECFIKNYISFSGDFESLKVLDFYKCLRAFIRGKVESLKSIDEHIPKEEKLKYKKNAEEYFILSCQYAGNF